MDMNTSTSPIEVGHTVTFRVDGDGEEMTGVVAQRITTNTFDIFGYKEELADEDLPALLVDTERNGAWVIREQWVTNAVATSQYRIVLEFTANRPLTADEEAAILNAVIPQVEEPEIDPEDETVLGRVRMDVDITIDWAEVRRT